MGRKRGGKGAGTGSEEIVRRAVLLDASFLVALERETARGEVGPARTFLPSLRGRQLAISIVSVEELLEGAADEAAALASLQRFAIQGLHLAQARRCALLQRRSARRMADALNADIVGADRAAFERLGARYLRFG
jgi:predicted nucleic acid-binding protein